MNAKRCVHPVKGNVVTVLPSACPECGAAGGEPHVQPCSFQQRYEAGCNTLNEWLMSLHTEYARLKANAPRTRSTASTDGNAARP